MEQCVGTVDKIIIVYILSEDRIRGSQRGQKKNKNFVIILLTIKYHNLWSKGKVEFYHTNVKNVEENISFS